jgi:hypothetical protein
MGQIWLCCCGWQAVGSASDEKSFQGVANRRDGYTMVRFMRTNLRIVQAKAGTWKSCTSITVRKTGAS